MYIFLWKVDCYEDQVFIVEYVLEQSLQFQNTTKSYICIANGNSYLEHKLTNRYAYKEDLYFLEQVTYHTFLTIDPGIELLICQK